MILLKYFLVLKCFCYLNSWYRLNVRSRIIKWPPLLFPAFISINKHEIEKWISVEIAIYDHSIPGFQRQYIIYPMFACRKEDEKNENYYGKEGSNFSMHLHSLNAWWKYLSFVWNANVQNWPFCIASFLDIGMALQS